MKITDAINSKSGILPLTILAVVLLFPTGCLAQKNTDFSGTWNLNESKSNLGQARFRMSMPVMTVVQKDNSLELTRTMVNRNGQERKITETYSLDGKEVSNENYNGTRKSTCKWSDDGKTLIITSSLKAERNGQVIESHSEDSWSLSKDGKTLTIVSASSNFRGERTITLVYDKN